MKTFANGDVAQLFNMELIALTDYNTFIVTLFIRAANKVTGGIGGIFLEVQYPLQDFQTTQSKDIFSKIQNHICCKDRKNYINVLLNFKLMLWC